MHKGVSLSSTKIKKLTITGMVSNDGKTIRGEPNTAWIVTNGEKLQNFLGRQVPVKGTLDPLTKPTPRAVGEDGSKGGDLHL